MKIFKDTGNIQDIIEHLQHRNALNVEYVGSNTNTI